MAGPEITTLIAIIGSIFIPVGILIFQWYLRADSERRKRIAIGTALLFEIDAVRAALERLQSEDFASLDWALGHNMTEYLIHLTCLPPTPTITKFVDWAWLFPNKRVAGNPLQHSECEIVSTACSALTSFRSVCDAASSKDPDGMRALMEYAQTNQLPHVLARLLELEAVMRHHVSPSKTSKRLFVGDDPTVVE